jgi:hypothetical protein
LACNIFGTFKPCGYSQTAKSVGVIVALIGTDLAVALAFVAGDASTRQT